MPVPARARLAAATPIRQLYDTSGKSQIGSVGVVGNSMHQALRNASSARQFPKLGLQ